MASMKHPIVLALGAALLIVLLALVAPLLHMGREPVLANTQDLPWQATATADGGLRVFGLTLGRDTLADAQQRFGDSLQVALVARLGEVGALEALVEPFNAGFVSGRLVLSFEVAEATLRRWREQAPHSEPMDGGVRRFKLHGDHSGEALRAPIRGLSFVPAVRLSDADVRQRFGAPAAETALADQGRTLLYPERGLSVTVAEGRRAVLEYVAPRHFASRWPGAVGSQGAAASAPVGSAR